MKSNTNSICKYACQLDVDWQEPVVRKAFVNAQEAIKLLNKETSILNEYKCKLAELDATVII